MKSYRVTQIIRKDGSAKTVLPDMSFLEDPAGTFFVFHPYEWTEVKTDETEENK